MAISTFANNTSTGSGTVTGGTTFNLTKPTGCVDGDFVLAWVCATDNIGGMSNASLTQQFNTDETGLDSGLWIASRVISGDGASWAVLSTGTETYAYVAIALRGVDPVTPLGAKNTVSGASSVSMATPSISVTNPGAWIIAGCECDVSTPGATFTFPGTMVGAQQIEGTLFASICAGYEDLGGATGSTSRTITSSIADVYVSGIFEINPLAVGGTTYLNTHLPFFS